MRILIVSQYFWPENFRISDLAAGLVEKGHDVHVLTGIPNYPTGRPFPGYSLLSLGRQVYRGVQIYRVPLFPRFKGKGWQLALNYFSFALSGSVFGNMRCKGPYDCLLVYEPSPITVGIPAIILRSTKKSPMLFWVQDLWPESLTAAGAVTSEWVLDNVKRLVRFIYRRCDTILIQSRAFHDMIGEHTDDRTPVAYLPNHAEKLFKPVILEARASERELLPSGFILMFAGNIGESQDFPTILKAAELLKPHKDIHIVILGSGRKKGWVEAQIRRKGLYKNVHLMGRHPLETMPRFFSLADAMLVTLKRNPIFDKTIPSKVQTYMACGKPIVAALAGEGANIVAESGGGVTCLPEKPAELADAILKVANLSEPKREKMGAASLAYFNTHFERETILNRLVQLMRDTIGRNKA